MRSGVGMGNEVSVGEGEPEEKEEEEGWTSREESEASGGLWSVSYQLDDGQEVCVFTCLASSASQTQLCQSGAEHLRLLRHPSILKFLTYDISSSPVILVTEPVLPVKSVMSGMCVEGMVTGWRCVAEGLLFLHDKAKISHNSLCCECVFMCANTSRWKIGGFEAAAHHAKITHSFIEMIAAIRPPSTVPPEDKSPSAGGSAAVPCHSRDVWAFAHLMLAATEEAGLSSHISDPMYAYIQQHMLNSDPNLRPTVQEVLTQQWMRNEASEIAEFLSHLTVKPQTAKDEFFASLTPRLHALPPRVVAEHLIPLLLTPLVMAEPVAHRFLWPHLLTPASATHPKQMTFNPSKICPLFDEELFTCHAVPILLNLMENHDFHVRMVLLEHLLHFASLCPEHELITTVLPEVLVGLHDCRDDMVQATLRSLADLVDTLGGETVVGTPRSNIFADSTPRVRGREGPSVEGGQQTHKSQSVAVDKTAAIPPTVSPASLPSPLHLPSLSSQEETRRQRAEKMRERREMQRQKKMAASSKLGVASSRVDVQGEESEDLTTPTTTHAQYSPSVSHDEEDRATAEIGEGEVTEQEEGEGEEEGDFDEEWEEFTNEGRGSKECESGNEMGLPGSVGERTVEVGWSVAGTLHSPNGVGKKMPPSRSEGKLKSGVHSKSGTEEREKEQKRRKEGEDDSWARARLREEDRLRLEEQAAWSREPDLFADMTPTITKTSSPESGAKSSSLQYQPAETEEGDGWGGWEDF